MKKIFLFTFLITTSILLTAQENDQYRKLKKRPFIKFLNSSSPFFLDENKWSTTCDSNQFYVKDSSTFFQTSPLPSLYSLVWYLDSESNLFIEHQKNLGSYTEASISATSYSWWVFKKKGRLFFEFRSWGRSRNIYEIVSYGIKNDLKYFTVKKLN